MFDVIMSDPAWRYDFSNSNSRTIERRYPTMTLDDIKAMRPFMHALANEACVLFLWCPLPKLPQGLAVMDAWGWTYKTADPWNKMRIGRGYYWRGRHELLLLGTRGPTRTPLPANRPPGGMDERRASRHSRKPLCAYERIERMYPEAARLEMFARPPLRDGWHFWGDDVLGREWAQSAIAGPWDVDRINAEYHARASVGTS